MPLKWRVSFIDSLLLCSQGICPTMIILLAKPQWTLSVMTIVSENGDNATTLPVFAVRSDVADPATAALDSEAREYRHTSVVIDIECSLNFSDTQSSEWKENAVEEGAV